MNTRRAGAMRPAVLATAIAVALAGCAVPAGTDAAGASPASSGSGGATAAATPAGAQPGTQVAAPSQQDVDTARAEVAKLSTRQVAAQLVVPDLGSVDAGVRGIGQGYGGVVVMRSALPSGRGAAGAAKAANARYATAMSGSKRSWPAFIAVDQEGGPVTRIDAPLTPFPAAMALGAAKDPALASAVGRASGSELRGLGFTVVMAPDADVTTPKDPTIGVRSPGSDPARVATTALSYVQGYRQAGLVPVVKHFPGHGSVSADTHAGTARLTASRAVLDRRDLVPFRKAVEAGVPAVMTAHVIATAIDAKRPASLSRPVTTGVLRQQLGFSGLVVTDALNMGAVTAGTAPGEATVRAIEAGADVALMPADPKAAVSALEEAVASKRLTRARLDESAVRMIVALRGARASVPAAAPGSHRSVAQQVAAATITQIGGRCGARAVRSAVTVSGGTAADRAEFTRAAKARGLRIGGARATKVVLLGGGRYQAGTGGSSGGTTGSGDVLVALDTPYGLAQGRATTRIAAYGRTPATFDAVVDVLTGKAPARGRLPVAVGASKIGSGCG
ncbi:glycoside hydrolase family 3 protein [Mobilicoccus caccae]|uniref:Beta-N-acetylhexosaminidase n=1 Tax=Mobilicoccus caccae TaxID=1859295 RepID=A0ABQ6IRV4_9MICO|nr:glycoside hydrolase family 3 N-terminal domain-containing protein [Mobilicoccus caccae]GMA40647.1 beta-N-acetylhexosaminidase [Mobilicoccus caccae]